jgi:hypothetical protein
MQAASRHQSMSIEDGRKLPVWQRPITLLIVMAAAMPFGFSVWMALLNNFTHEVSKFDGFDIGALHAVREIPGFFAVLVIVLLFYIREQFLALISLLMLGAATAVTSFFPTFGGLLMTTFIGSIGFHYYETVAQSLQLQWIDKKRAPQVLGWILAAGSASSLLAYGLIVVGFQSGLISYDIAYVFSGVVVVLVAVYCWLAFPKFQSPNEQRREFILRRRYWLYYALQFMSGARRQIFLVFAAWMMVEHFGFAVHEVTALFMINFAANMIFAPIMGQVVARFGERNALIIEYVGLAAVFSLYGGIYYFGWGALLGAALYILDHLFFALAFALKTYFQKIADPADIAPTAAVAFTINHIAAVALPLPLGLLWLFDPGAVFGLATLMALTSLGLALLIPRHPAPGCETILTRVEPKPAE